MVVLFILELLSPQPKHNIKVSPSAKTLMWLRPWGARAGDWRLRVSSSAKLLRGTTPGKNGALVAPVADWRRIAASLAQWGQSGEEKVPNWHLYRINLLLSRLGSNSANDVENGGEMSRNVVLRAVVIVIDDAESGIYIIALQAVFSALQICKRFYLILTRFFISSLFMH